MWYLDTRGSQAKKIESLLFESPELVGSHLKLVYQRLKKGEFLGIKGAVAVANDQKRTKKLEAVLS